MTWSQDYTPLADKDRAPIGGELHTGLKLAVEGESLGLVKSDRTTIEWEYRSSYPAQSPNVSYGINPSSRMEGYHPTPTPRAANSAGLTNVLAPVTFSHRRGFYDSSFQVSLAYASPNVTIRYTLDGSQPTASAGTVYSSPIPINTTRVQRALAYRSGYFSQPMVTHTYTFPAHVLDQSTNPPGYLSQWTIQVSAWYGMYPGYPDNNETLRQGLLALPTLCIAGSVNDIFGSSTGYYTRRGTDSPGRRLALRQLQDAPASARPGSFPRATNSDHPSTKTNNDNIPNYAKIRC